MQRGIAVAYMAAYSGLGPKGALRIAVFATHTPAMIGRLLEELGRIV
jgi:glycine C-acetyltransferase/8-amino-7-oxononanoate synthase